MQIKFLILQGVADTFGSDVGSYVLEEGWGGGASSRMFQ